MKNCITVFIMALICAGTISQLSAQDKKEEIKVVVIEKVENADGTIVEKKIVKTGAEAEAYMEKMKSDEASDIQEIEVMRTQKYKLVTIDDEGNEQVMEWEGTREEMPADMKEKLEQMDIDISEEIDVETVIRDGQSTRNKTRIIKKEEGGNVIEMEFEGDDVPDDVRQMLKEEGVELHVMRHGDDMEISIEKEKTGNSNKAQLGVYIEEHDKGVEVLEIINGSAAEKAGLVKGMVITRVNDTPVHDIESLIASLSGFEPNDIVIVETLSGNDRKAYEVVLQERKEAFKIKSWKEVENTIEKIEKDGEEKETIIIRKKNK